MIKCCEKEMLVFGRWHHCEKCHKRLINIPRNEDRIVIAELISEYVMEYKPTWKEYNSIIHELWKLGNCDGYEPKLPQGWKTGV